MRYLLDTNIFMRLVNKRDKQHTIARQAILHLLRDGNALCYVPQNLIEFWVGCTRPVTSNGLGLSAEETNAKVKIIERYVSLLPDNPQVLVEWRQMVVTNHVLGVQAHDTRLAAAMRVHGVQHLLTFNTGDFKRFGVTAVDPATV